MLKLTRMLFVQDPQRATYADFYERSLYNGILASQDPGKRDGDLFQGAAAGLHEALLHAGRLLLVLHRHAAWRTMRNMATPSISMTIALCS